MKVPYLEKCALCKNPKNPVISMPKYSKIYNKKMMKSIQIHSDHQSHIFHRNTENGYATTFILPESEVHVTPDN